MKSRLVQIGNSRGVRLSKAVLEHAALSEEIEITAEPGVISIRSAAAPRAGWAQSAASGPAEEVLDGQVSTSFDEDWTW